MKMSLVICLCFLSLSSVSFAQRTVEIKNANTLEDGENIGKGVKRLIGNVALKEGNMYMYCDSAYLFPDNSIKAFHNLHIVKGDSVNIYGTLLNYNGPTRIAEITKNVRLIEKGSTLQTELLYYDTRSSVATYPNGCLLYTSPSPRD